MTRHLTLSCGNKEDCLKLAEELSKTKGVQSSIVSISVRHSFINITIFGNNTDAEATRRALISAYKKWREVKGWVSEGKHISIPQLMKAVGRPFPTEALQEVLKVLGYKASLKGNELIVEGVKWDMIVDIASGLSFLLEELRKLKPKSSRSAKSLITSYALLRKISTHKALQELTEAKAIKVTGPRVVPTKEWRSLLRILLGMKRGATIGDRGKEED